jgi:hypothetical protein
MKPHGRVVVSFLAILALPPWLTTTAQSPSSTPVRGKNGGSQERKLEGPRTMGPTQQRSQTIQTAGGDRDRTSSPSTGVQNVSDEPRGDSENIRLAVDLVVLDAQVIQQKTGRVAGNLKMEDFLVAGDGVRTRFHFR